jgi:mannose-1-phosphate guanylyltransferase
MEHASHVFCIKSTFEWDDVGAFDALLRTMPVDSLGNVIIGNVAAIDCANCVLYNESSTAVLTAVGLQNQLLVQTKDAVLGAKLDDAQRVKEIVSLLKETSFI